MKFYQYKKCSTCVKAKKFLEANEVEFKEIDITSKPPMKKELKQMLAFYDGNIRKLFNTSGMIYRELSLKDKLPTMSEKEAIDLLSSNGKLVKRPFLLGDNFGQVGFKEDEWKERI